MTTGLFLTEADRAILQLVIADWRAHGAPNRGRQFIDIDEFENPQAPDTYIAIPNTPEGITGLERSRLREAFYPKASLNGQDDVVGYGECDIYQIIAGKLNYIETSQAVYNTSEARLRNEWIPVTRTKFGAWITINHFTAIDCIVAEELEAAEGPLTGATTALAYPIEWKEDDVDTEMSRWELLDKPFKIINRSVNIRARPGTYGVVGRLGGEFRPIVMDCNTSEEAVQAVILMTVGVDGGLGDGGLGDGNIGG